MTTPINADPEIAVKASAPPLEENECEVILISTGVVREVVTSPEQTAPEPTPSHRPEPPIVATTGVSNAPPFSENPNNTRPLSTPREGQLRVIQEEIPGSRGEDGNAEASFMAIISVEDINIPLGMGHTCEKVADKAIWEVIDESGRVFRIECTGSDEEKKMLQDIMAWFLRMDGSKEKGWVERQLDEIGRKGESWVDKMGDHLNKKILEKMGSSRIGNDDCYSPKNDASPANVDGEVPIEMVPGSKRNVKLGGTITKGVLGGVRAVTQVGANVAGKITDKASDVVGGIIGNNPVMRNMRNAPEKSKRKSVHRVLTSGMVAAGRIYLKADEKGKLIIESVGDEMATRAGHEYGEEAESATKNAVRISINTYRIARFPAKLGASSLTKGAMKGLMVQETRASFTGGYALAPQGKYVPTLQS